MEDKPKEILKLEKSLGFEIDPHNYILNAEGQITKLEFYFTYINNLDFLKEFQFISSLILHHAHITDFSGIKNLLNLETLHLEGNQINDLKPLSKLFKLNTLNCSLNPLQDLTPLQSLVNLTSLNLSHTNITSISNIALLTNLKELTISSSKISDISSIERLINLEKAEIINVPVVDITNLKHLSNLKILNLAGTKISNISSLKNLVKLDYLNLSNTEITEISDLINLKNLKILGLNGTRITDFSLISIFKNLEYLDLGNNQLSNISIISPLNKIIQLHLDFNEISDISPLQNLKNIENLHLRSNQISDISVLQGLNNIKTLDLRSNKIANLYPIKHLLEKGIRIKLDGSIFSKGIYAGNNPISHPPLKTIKQGNVNVLKYLEQYELEQQKGTRPINEAKMIIIGEPESGKTTLMNYLLGKHFTVPSTTQGFTIDQWKIKENDTDYRINIWDFGGQDIQSTVHQFFLTQDTLYLMVLNARKDELPDKYIEQIKSYAPESPIIIVVNRIEENPSYEMGVKRLQETQKDKEGNSLIKGVFKVSLLKGHKELDPSYFPILEEMKQAIQKALLEMPHIHRSVPITYLDVKEYLESAFFEDKPYISHDTYEQICREKGLNVESDDDLLGYLNNLGTVRYFDDLSLRNLQILNPEWLSDGVYRILVDGRTKQLRGIITERDFDTILQKTEEHQFEYPKKHYNYLIQMIRKFDMGYYDEDTKRIFIPRAFGLDYVQNFDSTVYKNEAIHFFFRYESFIPSTIMPAFISRMFGLVKDHLYSQNGVVLEQNGQFALVEQTTIKNRIDIWVSGDKSQGEYFEFFLEIRKVFREFHEKRPGLVVDEMIGLGKNSDVSVKYKQLIANKINGVNTYISEDGTSYNIDELLGRFESKNNTVQYITEQHNYNISGDMYSGQIYLLKHHTNELIELLKQNKANFAENKQDEIEKIIADLERVETAPTDKSAAKGILQQLNETRKNIGKIMSEEGVKWFTKSALDGRFNETFMTISNKVMQGLQNPLFRDFVDHGSNLM